MLVDYNTKMSAAQAVTASAASTSYIDQGAKADAVQPGIWVEFIIRTAYTGNSATVAFALETDSDSGFATAKVVLFSTAAIADTLLVAGYSVKVKVPVGAKRYLRAYYTVTGTGVAGTIDAMLVNDVDVAQP